MKKAIKEFKQQVKDEGLVDGEYVILIIAFKDLSFGQSKKIQFVYKNIKDFSDKCEKDCETIGSEFGIRFEWYLFD